MFDTPPKKYVFGEKDDGFLVCLLVLVVFLNMQMEMDLKRLSGRTQLFLYVLFGWSWKSYSLEFNSKNLNQVLKGVPKITSYFAFQD